MKYSKEALNGTMNAIIRESFPELQDVKIKIKYGNVFKNDDAYCIYNGKIRHAHRIKIDKTLGDLSGAMITGGMVHELCHIVWAHKLSKKKRKIDDELYANSFEHRMIDERNTDLETVLRGYKKELIELMEYYALHPTKEWKKGKYCGMTAEELKRL